MGVGGYDLEFMTKKAGDENKSNVGMMEARGDDTHHSQGVVGVEGASDLNKLERQNWAEAEEEGGELFWVMNEREKEQWERLKRRKIDGIGKEEERKGKKDRLFCFLG